MNLRQSTRQATHASIITSGLTTCDFCCFPAANLRGHIKMHGFTTRSTAKIVSDNPFLLAEWKREHGYTDQAGQCGICKETIKKRSLKRHIQRCREVDNDPIPHLEEAPIVKFKALGATVEIMTPLTEPAKKRRKRLNRIKIPIANITDALDDLPDLESDQDSSGLESSEDEC